MNYDDPDREVALRRYLRALATLPPPRLQQEQDLARRAASGDEDARRLLLALHGRLVVSVAKRYLGRGLSLFDLILAGNDGLEDALARYDPEGGVRFVAYAQHWIRAAISQAIDDSRGS